MGFTATILAAVAFHGILFALVQPKMGDGLGGIPVTPNTFYLTSTTETSSMTGTQVRTVASPVLFSLPSQMGFSRALYEQKIRTPRFLPKPEQREHFLEATPVQSGVELSPDELMLTSIMAGTPELPAGVHGEEKKRLSARRVTLAPELKERIVGGVVLPAELNQEVSNAWEVRAQLRVSEHGVVEHVFLEKPLDSASLNMGIMKLLYGLQFDAGRPIDGTVEIYSPEPSKLNPEGEK